VTPQTVFLRTRCILPNGFRLRQELFCTRWAIVENATAPSLEQRIRGAGWHFLGLQASSSHLGFGQTSQKAIHNAIEHALERVKGNFNAAEVHSLRVFKYPGFRIAKVTLHARHIQQGTKSELTYA
jgi:hypothetical protein